MLPLDHLERDAEIVKDGHERQFSVLSSQSRFLTLLDRAVKRPRSGSRYTARFTSLEFRRCCNSQRTLTSSITVSGVETGDSRKSVTLPRLKSKFGTRM